MSSCCGEPCNPTNPAAEAPVLTATANTLSSRIRIEQMDCPTEEKLIRDRLGAMPAVAGLQFNLLQRLLTVQHAPGALPELLSAIGQLGMTAQIEEDASPAGPQAAQAAPRKPVWPLVLAGVAAVSAEVLHFAQLGPEWLVACVALLAIACCGLSTYKKGWIALRNRSLNINALMSIAVTGALLIGQWPEAAMVMCLFAIAELIEARSLDRARNAIRGLLDLTPEQATVLQADGSWVPQVLADISPGAVVRVRPGERIALDGEVISGQSTVDQAPITGESLPVEKGVGDALFAGTINQAGSLEYRVLALASNSTLARIIHAVEQAQGARAPTQRFVDRFAEVYTPLVFALALAVAVIPPLFMAGAWYDWIYRALVLLVVACPCALVISTPVTIVSGLAAAARKGILIKGGVYLEAGRRLSSIALDKTGTLTRGKPVQTGFLRLPAGEQMRCEVLAASLAARSDHPVSRAIAEHAAQQQTALLAVDHLSALPGMGVRGAIEGVDYQLGNHRMVEALGLCSTALEATLDQLERAGQSVVVLCDPQQPLAVFAVADTLKDSSREAIRDLQALGVQTLMLSGDNPHTAQAIATAVGIDQARGNQLPEDKLQAVVALQAQGQVVGMVGDGINDAPALARADIGFAMAAAGTDTAIETADVALMDDDLRKIPAFIRLSRQTAVILWQNIALALGIKALFLGFTLVGEASMWMAVFADMGVSLLVVFNGLRLLNK